MPRVRPTSRDRLETALVDVAFEWIVNSGPDHCKRYGSMFGVHHALAVGDEVTARRLAEHPIVVGSAANLGSSTHVLRWWQSLPDPDRPQRLVANVMPHNGNQNRAREHEAIFHVFMDGGWLSVAHTWARQLIDSTEPFPSLEPIFLSCFSHEINALRALGRFEEARERAGTHLVQTSDRFGTELPDGSVDCGESLEVTAAWRNMAYVELDDGCFEEAVELLEEVWRVTKLHLPEDHPETVTVLFNLAKAYMGFEAPDESIERHQQCFKMRQQSLGLGHIETIRSWKVLVDEEVDDQCGGIKELWCVATASLGPYHPEVIDILRLRARSVASEEEDLDAAWALFQDCIDRLHTAPEMHYDTLIRVIGDMARLHRMEGQFDDALSSYQHLQQVFSDHYGSDNPKTIEVGIPIAYVQFDRGCVSEGIAMLEETASRFEGSENVASYWATGTLEMLGDAYAEHGPPERAVEAYKRVIALEEEKAEEWGPQPESADRDMRMKLGTALATLVRDNEALELLQTALNEIEDDQDHDPDALIPAMKAYADLLDRQEQCVDAQKWRQRAGELCAYWEEEWEDEE